MRRRSNTYIVKSLMKLESVADICGQPRLSGKECVKVCSCPSACSMDSQGSCCSGTSAEQDHFLHVELSAGKIDHVLWCFVAKICHKMPKILSLHDVLELLKQALLASRDVITSSQICVSKLQRVFTRKRAEYGFGEYGF